jgi:HSP20 family protein
MSLIRINPLRELQDVHNLFNRFFGAGPERLVTVNEDDLAGGSWIPTVDIYETDSELVFTFETPGFERDHLNITVEDGRLIVSGERKVEQGTDRKYHRVERSSGRFYRSFMLPTMLDNSRVSASLKNGVLTVALAKREEAKPRQISVTVQ